MSKNKEPLPTIEELVDLEVRDQKAFEEAYPDGLEVKIRHGLFSYYETRDGLRNDGSWGPILTEQFGMHKEVVTVSKLSDYLKGAQSDAFYGLLYPDPDEERTVEEEATEEVELLDLEDDDLVDWIMGTGRFDGEKKPSAKEVVSAAEDDPVNAQRLLDAENRATGDNPRGEVQSGLGKIINA